MRLIDQTTNDFCIRLEIFGVGGVQLDKRPLDKVEGTLDSVEAAVTGSTVPDPDHYKSVAKFIEEMPRLLKSRYDPGFAVALFYRCLFHPVSGQSIRDEIRQMIRSGRDRVRVTWWIKDLSSYDAVFVGHDFNPNPPPFELLSTTTEGHA